MLIPSVEMDYNFKCVDSVCTTCMLLQQQRTTGKMGVPKGMTQRRCNVHTVVLIIAIIQ